MAKSLAIVLALCAFAACAAAEEIYSDKYDYVDVVSILSNDRIRTQYYECFMDLAPCLTPDAKFFKDKFPEAIVTKCRKCTQKQKDSFEKIVLYYTEKQPEQWKMLLAKAIANSQKKKN
uniref:Chemosensory protein n=1 Tax=Procecidochares utilis TaxID=716600 RepID=A0A7H9SSK5_9MUSC|nr:chemosensory protein [Procecidochares utilis]